MQKSTNRSEEVEQARVVKWSNKVAVRAMMPDLRWLHHSPNGGKRDAFTGAQMRAMGVKKGFPDLVLPVCYGAYSGLVIEMKSAVGKTTPEQKEWLAHFDDQDWKVEVIRSAQDARTALCRYFGINPDTAPALDDCAGTV